MALFVLYQKILLIVIYYSNFKEVRSDFGEVNRKGKVFAVYVSAFLVCEAPVSINSSSALL